MTDKQWERSPYCCVCGARHGNFNPDKVTYNAMRFAVRDSMSRGDWGMQIYPDPSIESVSITIPWAVYRFCSKECQGVFDINPLAYEARPSYIV